MAVQFGAGVQRLFIAGKLHAIKTNNFIHPVCNSKASETWPDIASSDVQQKIKFYTTSDPSMPRPKIR
ncbi:unnamed protein product [Taenia asiatica]|uniref:Uncharacterized protein n=1 Tax=Taenia asiatica TaxID=60517 RepID=A0A0R3VZC7_TAEAS|nr:unnamed protein product [Taenia asiatica]